MFNKPESQEQLRIAGTVAVLAVLTIGVAACSSGAQVPNSEEHSDGKPAIATTTNILGDVVTQIVGDQADVLVLLPPEVDPHSFQLSTREVASMYEADLIVANGLGLEESVAAQLAAAETAGVPVLSVGEYIDPLPFDEAEETEVHSEEEDDHSDHDHGPLDPHFWHDPQRMMLAVDVIEEKLGTLQGLDVQKIQSGSDAYRAELETLDAALEETYASIPKNKRVLVTQHQVFGYLAHRYDFEVLGSILPGGSTVAEASATDLTRVAAAIKESGVPAIFTDATQAEKLAHTVVRESGLDVKVIPLHTESLTAPGGGADTYIDMMEANAQSIVSGLTG